MISILEIMKNDGEKQERWSFKLADIPDWYDGKPIVFPNEDEFATNGGLRAWVHVGFESDEEREKCRRDGKLGTSNG